MLRILALCAVRAQAEDVDDVIRLGEPVLRGDVLRPQLDGIRLDLNRQSAVAADQMVVVAARRARTEEALALLLQRIGFALARYTVASPIGDPVFFRLE
jgi:hypothetical protein